MMSIPSGTVTFLFTDIEGSTRAWEENQSGRGQSGMAKGLARHNAILADAAAQNSGYVFKTIGDAFCIAFGTADDALATAIDAQFALAEEDWAALGVARPVRVRMALHTGPAQAQEGDYYGPALNRTARILATGHGGQVLCSEVVCGLVRDHLIGGMALRDLGEHRLKDLARPERVFQLDCPPLSTDFPALRSLDSRPHNLPVQLTAFVGREGTLADAVSRLRDPGTRLLTLLGPGGTGKTRIALQLAADCLDDFADGAFFVALEPVRTASLVASSIASVLGIDVPSGRDAREALVEHFRAKQVLLVLDNFEQVVDAASLVGELLKGALSLKVVVTSRESLRISGERVVAIPPLDLPSLRPVPALARLVQFEAVRLFIERAEAVKADFSVTSANAPAVAEICHRLDGLPLAIELAAARIRMFDAEALLARLSRGVGATLTGGSRDLTARQQTLKGAIAWSVDLLSPDERTLFARLGIFLGSFTYEAAEAVGSDEGEPGLVGDAGVLEAVEGLLDKSLLRRVDGSKGEPRVRMLETIREFALGLEEAGGEAEASRDRHLAWYMELAEESERHLAGPHKAEWDARLFADRDNLRHAADWAATVPIRVGRAVLGLRLLTANMQFWYMFAGGVASITGKFDALLASVDPLVPGSLVTAVPVGVPPLLLAWSRYSFVMARLEAPRREYVAMLRMARETFRRVGDAGGEAEALEWGACLHSGSGGDPREAIAMGLEAVSVYRHIGDTRQESRAMVQVAALEAGRGNLARAHELVADALGLVGNRLIPNQVESVMALAVLAVLHERSGELAEAETKLASVFTVDGLPLRIALPTVIQLAVRRGDLGRALELATELDTRFGSASDIGGLALRADVHRLLGETGEATALCRRALGGVVPGTIYDDGLLVHLCLARLAISAGDDRKASASLVPAIAVRHLGPFRSHLPAVVLEMAGLVAPQDPALASRMASLSRGMYALGQRHHPFPQDIARVRQVLIEHGADADQPFPDPMPGEAEVVAEALAALEGIT